MASRNAEKFWRSQAGIILAALREHGAMSKDGIANVTDLSGVQIARRMSDLFDAGLAKPTGAMCHSESGSLERVWIACE